MLLGNNNVHSPKKAEYVYIQKFQLFIKRCSLKHQYLPEKNYINIILMICSVRWYKNSSVKEII